MRSTVSDRLAAQLEIEKVRREAGRHRNRKAYMRRYWKRNSNPIQLWLKQARSEAEAETRIPTQDAGELFEQSGIRHGYQSQLDPMLWRYHTEDLLPIRVNFSPEYM